MYLGGNHVRVVCERVWRNAQDCAKIQGLATCKPPEVAHVPSMPEVEASASWSTTGQKVQTSRSVTLRLELTTQSSHEPALFWKTWLFTFHSHLNINTPFTHERKWVSKENFERETLEKNKIDSSPIFIKRLFKFLNSLSLHCQILKKLITKTFSHHIHFCERAV